MFEALPEHVDVYEVGPRDGLQNEKTVLSVETKLAMIEGLVDAGVRRIEITSFVNPRWIPALADHMELATRLQRREDVRYSALVPNMRGLDSASRAGMDEVAIFLAASESHNRKNINKTTRKAIETYEEVVREALDRGMKVRGYVSCVYGCPYEGQVPYENVEWVSKMLLELGVYELSLGDTIGVGTPRQVATILRGLIDSGVRRDQMAVHFHDTRGTALANVTVALQLGIPTVDSSLGGLGGCPYAPGASGNVATEDVVFLLDGMGVDTGIDLGALPRISTDIATKLGHELPSKYLKAHVASCANRGVPV
ncbi:hydroxymethylglutaryl-CoA lyase [Pseudenhygromyxa sp. WMMC2535]|nr:hydroxymethylglutaryl-CoA lyase [Pseudenhygromyxa sp. WMMC2535]NVB41562.1 hydroxymethylglutaryl-CoA lyase [Pseudenhygromyxa sp. WMMC2535]